MYSLILLLISAILFCTSCVAESSHFARFGQIYYESDLCMAKSTKNEFEKFAKCQNQRDDIINQIKQSNINFNYLKKEYIDGNLTSKRALIPTFVVKRLYDEDLVKTIFDDYNNFDDFWFKFYVWNYINSLDKSYIKINSEQIFNMFKNEDDENLRAMVLYSLFYLKNEFGNKISIRILEDGSVAFQRSLCATLLRAKEKGEDIESLLIHLSQIKGFQEVCPLQ